MPDLINSIADLFYDGALGRFVGGKVCKANVVFGLFVSLVMAVVVRYAIGGLMRPMRL